MVIATHGLRVVTYVMLLHATIKLGVVPARGTVPIHFYKKKQDMLHGHGGGMEQTTQCIIS
jgi:hypothetical protein